MPTHTINEYEEQQGVASFFEKIGANTETWLQRSFERWGCICAQKPWLILFVGLCVVVALGHGVKYLKVTTDPVELWASPTSRSRVEREYFDSNFEPFYRTEQIIIHAVGLDKIVHKTPGGVLEFGPAFNDTFLREVFDLQQSIMAIGKDTPHSLDKICFAPLRSQGQINTKVKECVVQSIWGYYQDDMNTFNYTDTDDEGFVTNYLDHFLECSQ